jgi:hypothetical protein
MVNSSGAASIGHEARVQSEEHESLMKLTCFHVLDALTSFAHPQFHSLRIDVNVKLKHGLCKRWGLETKSLLRLKLTIL